MQALIVDDDQVTLEVVRDSVNWEQLNIDTVYTAINAEQARQIIQTQPVDVIISDIEMPRETGLELLRWYRAEQYDGKFLLLTCCESFSYAADAIRYRADEYLTKPFNVEIMDMTLQKIVRDLVREKKEKNLTQWLKENTRQVQRNFMESLLSGERVYDREALQANLQNMGISLDPDREYRLIVSGIRKAEMDHSVYGNDFIRFFLEEVHEEIIANEIEEGATVVMRDGNQIFVVIVSRGEDEIRLLADGERLIRKVDSLTDLTLTICISEPVRVESLADAYRRLSGIMNDRVSFYGQSFLEKDINQTSGANGPVLDMKELDLLMERGDRKAIMDYVKKEMDARKKMLDQTTLEILQTEVRQTVYSYLSGRGIQMSSLLDNERNRSLASNATTSVIGMMKWINYLLDTAFSKQEELDKSEDIIEKIHRYVAEHYMEDIGRNEIGAHFFLVPEYLSKMYKKKTGVNLKDYINEYRIERAKILLADPRRNVGDVAMAVGFGNISYFSTVFKKVTGTTPNEYRKN